MSVKEKPGKLVAKLDALPPKEKGGLLGIVASNSEAIRRAMQKGYTYKEIAETLSEEPGVSISADTLRVYMGQLSRRSDTEPKPRKARARRAPRSSESPRPVTVSEPPSSAASTTGDDAIALVSTAARFHKLEEKL